MDLSVEKASFRAVRVPNEKASDSRCQRQQDTDRRSADYGVGDRMSLIGLQVQAVLVTSDAANSAGAGLAKESGDSYSFDCGKNRSASGAMIPRPGLGCPLTYFEAAGKKD